MAIQINLCQLCGDDAAAFTDEVPRREYAITGACQRCQDEIFAEPEYDPALGERCPHCGSHVCYIAQIPGPLLCGNTGEVVRS